MDAVGEVNAEEPESLAKTIASLKLNYVVITSVDRDDLRDVMRVPTPGA